MEYFKRLGNFWFPKLIFLLWLVFGAMGLYFFQTFIHEGTHAVSAAFSSGHMPTLAPFPHQRPNGDFLNGVTLGDPSTTVTNTIRTSCDSPAKTPTPEIAGFIGMPQVIDLVIISLLFLIFFFVPISNSTARFLLVLWYLGATFDFCYNTIRSLIGGCNPGADWSRVMLEADISNGLFAVLTWTLWIVFVLSHFAWVYFSQWGQTEVEEVEFWDYRWVGLVFGALSLICVIWSLAVSDPSIDKGSVFIAFFILHIVFMIGNFLLFGLSFKFKT
jgi:hypothetical protein